MNKDAYDASIEVFWDDKLESYILMLHKGRMMYPVRIGAVQLSLLHARITEVLGEAEA